MEYAKVFEDFDFNVANTFIGLGPIDDGNLILPDLEDGLTAICKYEKNLYRIKWHSVVYARRRGDNTAMPCLVYLRRCKDGNVVPHIIQVKVARGLDGRTWFPNEETYIKKQGDFMRYYGETFMDVFDSDEVPLFCPNGKEPEGNENKDKLFRSLLESACPQVDDAQREHGLVPHNVGYAWNPDTQEIEKRDFPITNLRFVPTKNGKDRAKDGKNLGWMLKADVAPLPNGVFRSKEEVANHLDPNKDLKIIEL